MGKVKLCKHTGGGKEVLRPPSLPCNLARDPKPNFADFDKGSEVGGKIKDQSPVPREGVTPFEIRLRTPWAAR